MAAVPADHGPRKDPAMPPEATVARSGSLSNHSPARSATAIGIQRSSRYASALPSARNARPVLRSSIRSAAFGSSSAGGVDLADAAQDAGDGGEAGEEPRIAIRVRGRECSNLVDRPPRIGPQHERAAIGCRCADLRFGTDDAEAVSLEGKAANDGRIDGRRVRQRRTAESRREIAGPGAAAHAIHAFEDERLQAGLREEGGGNQPVMSAADDDNVVRGSSAGYHDD